MKKLAQLWIVVISIALATGVQAEASWYAETALFFNTSGCMSFGVGLVQEVDGSLDLKDVGLGKVDVDDALGQIAAINWHITDFFNLGARYTFIEYELSDFSNEYDGNNLSVVASFTF